MKFNNEFSNVELHTHLDGSLRPETILKIARQRNMLNDFKTVEDIIQILHIKSQSTLRDFLKPFLTVIPVFCGDKDAIYEMASDFIQQCVASKTCYVEARFCPHILSGTTMKPSDVIKTVLDAFSVVGSNCGVEARALISGLREQAEETYDLISLAKQFMNYGVVGIDIAGDEEMTIESGGTDKKLIKTFNEAERAGIHRTVHAGENGPASSVMEAVYKLHAERIGHGYHCLNDENLYEELKKRKIHFEVCPSSSFLTGAVVEDPNKHPIHTFSKDKVCYSINTDDTMITGRLLHEEYAFCKSTFYLDDAEICRTIRCAANAAFLSQFDKGQLSEHLRKFGI